MPGSEGSSVATAGNAPVPPLSSITVFGAVGSDGPARPLSGSIAAVLVTPLKVPKQKKENAAHLRRDLFAEEISEFME